MEIFAQKLAHHLCYLLRISSRTGTLFDWGQLLGVFVAVFSGLFAFLKLLSRDKLRENQINALSEMAREAADQTILMRDSNELMRKQLAIQSEAFGEDVKHKKAVAQMEEAERKASNLPRFRVYSVGRNSHSFTAEFTNIGKFAKYLGYRVLKVNYLDLDANCQKHEDVNTGERIRISATINHKNTPILEIDILFSDILGNTYSQRFSSIGSGNTIGNPVEEPAKPSSISSAMAPKS